MKIRMRPKDAKLRARVKQYIRLMLSTNEEWTRRYLDRYMVYYITTRAHTSDKRVDRAAERFARYKIEKQYIKCWHTICNFIMKSPIVLGEVKREMIACNFMKTNDTVFVNSLAEVI